MQCVSVRLQWLFLRSLKINPNPELMKVLINEFGERLTTLHNGKSGLRGSLQVKVTANETDPDVLTMRASNERLDRYDEVIVAAGWKLDDYQRNPVIQNSHQYGDICFTIGKALKTVVEGNELLQVWKFATKANPIAKIARDMYAGGFLHASSVGFVPIRWENGTQGSGFYRKYLEQELLEVSAVAIPANADALALAVKTGAVAKSDLRELAQMLKHFCNDQAGSRADAGAPGAGTNGAQWLQSPEFNQQLRSLLR